MKLYHGTSAKALDSILGKGLLPRTTDMKGNWEHTISSRKDCVYLTSIYAPYFAINASGDDNLIGIVEIDTNFLNEEWILPDEDFLEQATRGQKDFPKGTMEDRTKYFRDNLSLYGEHWERSINKLGTCCYQNEIDSSAITRAIIVDGSLCNMMLSVAMDPQISLLNHKFCSNKYKSLTKWFMGDDVLSIDIFAFTKEHWDLLPEKQKEHIENIMDDRSMIHRVK